MRLLSAEDMMAGAEMNSKIGVSMLCPVRSESSCNFLVMSNSTAVEGIHSYWVDEHLYFARAKLRREEISVLEA